MSHLIRTFEILCVPDTEDLQFQEAAGQDVGHAIRAACDHLLRCVASMPRGSASAALRLVFSPGLSQVDPQSRLRVYLSVSATGEPALSALVALVTNGPLARYYPLAPACLPDLDPRDTAAACHVFRRERCEAPSQAPDFNDRLPEGYYACVPLKPRESNDGMALDGVLHGLDTPAVLDICIGSTAIDSERAAHARMLVELQEVNQYWDRDDDPGASWAPFGRTHGEPGAGEAVTPFRRPDPLSTGFLRAGQRLQEESLVGLQCAFHMVAMAPGEEAARLVATVAAEAAFDDGCYRVLVHRDGDALTTVRGAIQGCRPLTPDAHPGLHEHTNLPPHRAMRRLAHVASVDELRGAFRLPISGRSSPFCIRRNTDPRGIKEGEDLFFGLGGPVHDGANGGTYPGMPRGIPLAALAKHMAVLGVPGSGKTTFNLNLSVLLAQADVPFVILECRKKEFRALKKLTAHPDERVRRMASALRFYTPGLEGLSPFRFNPLQPASSTPLPAHIDSVLASFFAAMPLGGPLPALLGEALEEVYEGRDWRQQPPTVADLVQAMETILEQKEYSAETNSDIRAALAVRLGSLIRRTMGHVLQCARSTPSPLEFASGNTVLELHHLPAAQACLLALLVLAAVCAVVEELPIRRGGLRLVIIIEEAHLILGSSSDAKASEENPDPKAFASDHICRMLAELRALGVGIVVSDQTPSAVAPEVLKNTGTKVAFRQVDARERELVAGAMLMTPLEEDDLARLGVGQAYLYTEGYHRPAKIQIPNPHRDLDLSPPSDVELAAILSRQPWYREDLRQRRENELAQLAACLDNHERKLAEIAGRIAALMGGMSGGVARPGAAGTSEEAGALALALSQLRRELMRGPVRRFLPDGVSDLAGTGLDDVAQALVKRIDTAEALASGCVEVLHRVGSGRTHTGQQENGHEQTQREEGPRGGD